MKFYNDYKKIKLISEVIDLTYNSFKENYLLYSALSCTYLDLIEKFNENYCNKLFYLKTNNTQVITINFSFHFNLVNIIDVNNTNHMYVDFEDLTEI